MKLVDLVLELNDFSNLDETLKVIEAGIRINSTKYKDPDSKIESDKHILKNNITVIRIGKNLFYILIHYLMSNFAYFLRKKEILFSEMVPR